MALALSSSTLRASSLLSPKLYVYFFNTFSIYSRRSNESVLPTKCALRNSSLVLMSLSEDLYLSSSVSIFLFSVEIRFYLLDWSIANDICAPFIAEVCLSYKMRCSFAKNSFLRFDSISFSLRSLFFSFSLSIISLNSEMDFNCTLRI